MNILSYILVAVIALGIGVFIGKKSSRFDGLFIIDETNENTTRFTVDLQIDPDHIPNKKELRLKVGKMMDEVV